MFVWNTEIYPFRLIRSQPFVALHASTGVGRLAVGSVFLLHNVDDSRNSPLRGEFLSHRSLKLTRNRSTTDEACHMVYVLSRVVHVERHKFSHFAIRDVSSTVTSHRHLLQDTHLCVSVCGEL